MLKQVLLIFVVVTAVSLSQTIDDSVPLDQRNVDFNEYFVYTRPMTNPPTKLTRDNLEILYNRTTLVLIHGHQGSFRSTMNEEIARGVLNILGEDVNVIILDWSTQAAYSYSNADASVPIVGRFLGDFLSTLSTVLVKPDRMHIVGFDLGAHIAGWAGRHLGELGARLARITGLDPSKSNYRLTKSDANYIELIHTDGGGVILGNGLGIPLGDADFFPNGGSSQPGCFLSHTCCHNRAWQLFAASLGWKTFQANCCNSMTQMKLNNCRGSPLEMGNNQLVKLNGCASGIYRITTKGSFPY